MHAALTLTLHAHHTQNDCVHLNKAQCIIWYTQFNSTLTIKIMFRVHREGNFQLTKKKLSLVSSN